MKVFRQHTEEMCSHRKAGIFWNVWKSRDTEHTFPVNRPKKWEGVKFSYTKAILEHFCQTGCSTAPINCRKCSFRFMILLCIITETGLQVLMLRNTSVFSYYPALQLCILPLSEPLCFSSCLFKAPPSWIPCLLWLVGPHMPEPASLQQQSSCAESILTA